MNAQHFGYFPDSSSRACEMQQARYLASQPPRIRLHRHTLVIEDNAHRYRLTRDNGTWQCSCAYSRTHSIDTDPCRHVRAVETWQARGQIGDLRQMAVDKMAMVKQSIAQIQAWSYAAMPCLAFVKMGTMGWRESNHLQTTLNIVTAGTEFAVQTSLSTLLLFGVALIVGLVLGIVLILNYKGPRYD